MKNIINYNKYHTGFDEPLIKEGKGIPHILKWIVDEIIENLNNFKTFSIDIDETDLKLKNLTVKYNNSERINIYAYTKFGIFSPKYERGNFENYLNSPTIEIFLDYDNYNLIDLKRVILHELLHIYEIYQRFNNKTTKDLEWFLNNELIKIRRKYMDDKFLNDFIFILYLSSNQEINARVAETYSILLEKRTTQKDILQDTLYKSNAWSQLEKIKKFNYKDYNIDYNRCIEFFTEISTIVTPKLKQDFIIFNIPHNNKDITNILKKYKTLFNKKSKKFENKLIKIIEEVIFDIKKIYNI
ncbi:MAG: hypothetical protein HPY57_16130 [Ignavibacteria bacterium]|nr:hypothetical protein [Ignavibacteria bacterium]